MGFELESEKQDGSFAAVGAAAESLAEDEAFDFGNARFDLNAPRDREVLRFVLSQVLYGEATAVYCGKSLYSAVSLEAANFYLRQARQEFNHLKLFGEIMRELGFTPEAPHWALKLLTAPNKYYPLKVFAEHAVGEAMVLDVFKELLMQTLPDSDPRVHSIKKKLRVVCQEEQEHVAWGEKETLRLLRERPALRRAFYGLLLLQLKVVPTLAHRFLPASGETHPVLVQVPAFLKYVARRVEAQGRRLGIVPSEPQSAAQRGLAMLAGAGLFLRSQLTRSSAPLLDSYIQELGFESGVSVSKR